MIKNSPITLLTSININTLKVSLLLLPLLTFMACSNEGVFYNKNDNININNLSSFNIGQNVSSDIDTIKMFLQILIPIKMFLQILIPIKLFLQILIPIKLFLQIYLFLVLKKMLLQIYLFLILRNIFLQI